MAKPQKSYMGCVFAAAMLGAAFAVLRPAFLAGRSAAWLERSLDEGKWIAQAAASHARSHKGRLPGSDWRARLEAASPSLKGRLARTQGDEAVGYAAVPGTLDKPLADLPGETVLYVGYRASRNFDVLQRVEDVGDFNNPGRATAVTAEDVRGGNGRFLPLARIGLLLGRQNAPGLR